MTAPVVVPDNPEDANQQPDPPQADVDPAPEPWEDPKLARKEIEKVRREAANWRAKVRDLEPLAQKWTEKVDSEKTELQKLQERAAELEAENQELSLKSLRQQIAAEAGLPSDFLPLLNGTPEEMTATAQTLAEKYASTGTSSNSVGYTRPKPALQVGSAAADQAPSMDDLIRSWR